MKKNKIFLALFAMVGLCGQRALFSETQALKVGFRQSHSLVMNKNMDLTSTDWKCNVFSQGSLFFEADSTDNVEGYISFVVERDWDNLPNIPSPTDSPPENVLAGNNVADGLSVSLDSAYVKMSEFLLSSLSVTVGRQDIVWGSGLVLCDGVPHSVTVREYQGSIKRSIALSSPYYSVRDSFDAVKLDMDAGNLQTEVFLGVVSQNMFCDGKSKLFADKSGDCHLLMGVKSDFLLPNGMTASGYFLSSREGIKNSKGYFAGEVVDQSAEAITTASSKTISDAVKDKAKSAIVSALDEDALYTHTLGFRVHGSLDQYVPNFDIEGEAAYQFGKIFPSIMGVTFEDDASTADDANDQKFKAVSGGITDRSAFAGFIGCTYTMKESPSTPKVSLSYDFRTGDDMDTDKNEGWHGQHYGRPIGHLIDLLSNYAALAEGLNFPPASSNIHGVTLASSFMPIESLEMGLSFVLARFVQEVPTSVEETQSDGTKKTVRTNDGKELGMEFMGHVQWAYSEDSRFILQGSIFKPQDGVGFSKETACELMSSVVVDF